jgi:hypothetical protein
MTGILRAIERWASASDDRMRLIVILVWASFGIFVLIHLDRGTDHAAA